MQVSRPHCCELEQALASEGSGRQTLAKQNSPEAQSWFLVHAASQCPPTQLFEPPQSLVVVHRGSASHTPLWHPQPEWQSELTVQAHPGHPKWHSPTPS
jgi:hypothetical protein